MKRVIYTIRRDEWEEDKRWRAESGLPSGKYRPYVDDMEIEFLVEEEVATILKLRHPDAEMFNSTASYGREEHLPWDL